MTTTQSEGVFLSTLKGEREDTQSVPIWMMRQAGRYQPAYRQLRKNYSFHQLSHESELIEKVTLIPLQYTPVDALIIFSDILVLLETLGYDFEIKENIGPVIYPEFDFEVIESLIAKPAKEVLGYVYEGIKAVKAASSLPLIGFCGAPFTLACYLIEGKSSKNFAKVKHLMYGYPNLFKKLLATITDACIDYLKGQEQAGVDMLQVFDTWAEQLSAQQFREFALPYVNKIADACEKPMMYFAKSSHLYLPDLQEASIDGLSVDCKTSLKEARKAMGKDRLLQGNLDPTLLYCEEKVIASHVDKILEAHALDPRFIFNLGHGILPDIAVERVQFLVDYVKNWKK